jgi:predicted SprT family Zn-dependent metalloprotease
MELIKAKKLANDLMTEHELIKLGWRFEFDNAKRRFGCCNYTLKLITLSKSLTELNDEARVKNTILHEIAHALVGSGNGHNHVWRKKALEIGCDGKRCYSIKTVTTPKSKYEAVCKKCNHVHKRHRKPKNKVSCGVCSNKFDANLLLEYKETK